MRVGKLNSIFYFILGGFVLLGILGIFAMPAISDIPPTRAFSMVTMAGQNITAASYAGSFEIVMQGDLTASINDDTITIKLKEFSCPGSTSVTGVYSNGTFICS